MNCRALNRFVLIAGLLVLSVPAFAMGKHRVAPPPAPITQPDPQDKVVVKKEYFHADTVKVRDACIAKLQAELQAQLAAQVGARSEVIVSPVDHLLQSTSGIVVDDSQGFEKFSYRAMVRIAPKSENGQVIRVRMDYPIYSIVSSTEGAPQDGLKGAQALPEEGKKVLSATAGYMVLGNIDVVNDDTGEVLFNISNPIPGTPEVDSQSATERLSRLDCSYQFPAN